MTFTSGVSTGEEKYQKKCHSEWLVLVSSAEGQVEKRAQTPYHPVRSWKKVAGDHLSKSEIEKMWPAFRAIAE